MLGMCTSDSCIYTVLTFLKNQTKTESVTIYEGQLGSFGDFSNEHSNYYACGIKMRHEASCFADCTGANGLILKLCHINDWDNQKEEIVEVGRWGEWNNGFIMCSRGKFVSGGQARYYLGSDNRGINGFKMLCGDTSGADEWHEVHPGWYGDWEPAVEHVGKYVTAGSCQMESYQGVFSDDSMMNGTFREFLCDEVLELCDEIPVLFLHFTFLISLMHNCVFSSSLSKRYPVPS